MNPYLFSDIYIQQVSKNNKEPCGDVADFIYTKDYATVVLSDGLGSGAKANIYAHLCTSRLLGLLKNGATLRQAFNTVVKTMNDSWGTPEPFAVFTLMRIYHTGKTTILSYEMPPPLKIGLHYAQVLKSRSYMVEKAVIHEVECCLEKGEGVLIISDGVSYAGIGKGRVHGWEVQEIAKYLNQYAREHDQIPANHIAELVLGKTIEYWKNYPGDDCSVVFAHSRRGIIANIITGPPADKEKDQQLVNDFMNEKGIKIVCGGSTAKMVARETRKDLVIRHDDNYLTPPKYSIDNINLATEGVVTLNQVYNMLDEEIEDLDKNSPVYELAYFLKMADRVNIWLGTARNLGETNIEFKQQGILPRNKIINLLGGKLKKMNKLVVIKEV